MPGLWCDAHRGGVHRGAVNATIDPFRNNMAVWRWNVDTELAEMSARNWPKCPREFAVSGGLIAYGPSVPALFQRAADDVDKILRGAKPADIPVQQPTKFHLVINLKTGKALGLSMPQTLLATADEVIE